MYEKAEMRTVMARLLKEAIQQDENIILLDADLARANGILPLFEEFPSRHWMWCCRKQHGLRSSRLSQLWL